jgi:Flp pilus assembly pilin Flp
VEYALLLAFVAAGIILGAEELATAVANQLTDTASCIETGGAVC